MINEDRPRRHDVSNEARVPKGQAGGGQWTEEDASQTSPRSGRIANSREPVPFTDDKGNPILNMNGRPMQRPSDVDLRFFVDQGLAAAKADRVPDGAGITAWSELPYFHRGGEWDIQRIGPDGGFVGAFRDAANVAIGLYGAAAGLPQSAVLEIANQVARSSHFATSDIKNQSYTHLPERDVYDIKKGYALYQSGQIQPSAPN